MIIHDFIIKTHSNFKFCVCNDGNVAWTMINVYVKNILFGYTVY